MATPAWKPESAKFKGTQDVSYATDDDSDSSSDSSGSSQDSSLDSSSVNSNNSGSSSGSSKRSNDASQSSRGSSSSGSSRGRSADATNGSTDGESSQGSGSSRSDGSSRSSRSGSSRSDGSSRSGRSSRSSRSGSSQSDNGSRSSGGDDESRTRSTNASDSDDGSRRSRSSSSGSDSDDGSRSSRSSSSGSSSSSSGSSRSSDSGSSRSDTSSRSSRSGSASSASGSGSDSSSSYEEVEVLSESESESERTSKDDETNEIARAPTFPKSISRSPAKFRKSLNIGPVKSFPTVQTSTPMPEVKAPDVKAKTAFVPPKSESGMAPWQAELKKRKETGSKIAGWKKPKKEESTIYVDEDEDDIAAMFFEAGGGKPETTKFQFGGGAKSASSENDDDDAAAMFRSAGQTDNDDDAAAMFKAASQTDSDEDAAAMFRAAGPTPATTTTQDGSGTPQTESGDGETVEAPGEQDHSGDGVGPQTGEALDVIEEEVEEVEELEEEIIVEEVDGEEEMIIEVEEFIDDETVGVSNEAEQAALLAAQLAEQKSLEEQRALEERRLAQQRAYEEMERVESQMKNYIASLNNEESARTVESDQSSVPWAMATVGDDDPTVVYGRYIQSARERRMDDQSSYFKPDMEIPTNDSVSETETFASSEQKSIPWDLEVRGNDSWANPVRRLQTTRTTEVLQPKGQKEYGASNINSNNLSMIPIARTGSSTSRKATNKRKRTTPTGFRDMVSAEVYKTSLPDAERETELWYHPGFSFLSQNPSARPYFPPSIPIKESQSPSFNGSDGTEKAIVSDLEITEHVYNTSMPAMTSNVTLLAFAEKMNNQWNLLESPQRSDDKSFSSSKASSEVLTDLKQTIMRTAASWTKKGHDSTSSESLSLDMLKEPLEDEGSTEEKRRNIVNSRSGGSVSIDLDPQTFEYMVEKGDSEASTITEPESDAKTIKPPCGIYGFMLCCFLLIIVPASVGVFFLLTQQSKDTAPAAANTNITSPTLAPTFLNEPTEETTASPTSAGVTSTLRPTIRDPVTLRPTALRPVVVPAEPVTEDLLFRLLASASVDNGEALRNRQSPQFAAMEWLRTPSGFSGVSDDDIFLQRYALATLYYSTAGESWTSNDRWLSDANVCDWFSSAGSLLCNDDSIVTALVLTNNGLSGNLPNEIGILSQLELIMLSGNTRLTGPVPSTLQTLSNLHSIFIEGTELSSLPPEICYLPLLQDFWADCEEIGCTCCNQCFF